MKLSEYIDKIEDKDLDDYNGCANCIHKNNSLETCKWMKSTVHTKMKQDLYFICPDWEKRDEEV